MASDTGTRGADAPPAYEPPTLTVLGSVADLTKTGLTDGKEHGANGRRPITLSNP